MSIDCITRVWNEAPYGGAALLALLALADYADDDGRSYPAVSTIAKKARLSDRGVQKLLIVLERDGWVTIDPGKGLKGTNLYTIAWGVNPVRGELGVSLSSPDPSVSGSYSDQTLISEKGSDPDGWGVRRAPPFRPEPQAPTRDHGALAKVIKHS